LLAILTSWESSLPKLDAYADEIKQTAMLTHYRHYVFDSVRHSQQWDAWMKCRKHPVFSDLCRVEAADGSPCSTQATSVVYHIRFCAHHALAVQCVESWIGYNCTSIVAQYI
jgi:hypothetical protein